LGLTGDWIKLHNEEFHDLSCSTNNVNVTKWSGIREEKCIQVWGGGALKGKNPLEALVLGLYRGG